MRKNAAHSQIVFSNILAATRYIFSVPQFRIRRLNINHLAQDSCAQVFLLKMRTIPKSSQRDSRRNHWDSGSAVRDFVRLSVSPG